MSRHEPDLGAESRLCMSCGMCCSGALYDRVDLEADDRDRTVALGFRVRSEGDSAVFDLPCPKLDGVTCTIYQQRPTTCAGYACRLLQEVRSGRDLAGALDLVAEARRLASELQQSLPSGVSFPEARAQLLRGALPPLAQLRSLALSHHLDRHFRNASDGPILKAESCS